MKSSKPQKRTTYLNRPSVSLSQLETHHYLEDGRGGNFVHAHNFMENKVCLRFLMTSLLCFCFSMDTHLNSPTLSTCLTFRFSRSGDRPVFWSPVDLWQLCKSNNHFFRADMDKVYDLVYTSWNMLRCPSTSNRQLLKVYRCYLVCLLCSPTSTN